MPFYEVTPWRCVGGASGSYELESPWDTPAELNLVAISGNSNGTVIFSFDDLGDVSILLTTFNQGIGTPGFRGLVCRVTADNPGIFSQNFIPVNGRRVYISTSVDTAGKAIYITASWRRLAPESGSYMHSAQNLAATYGLAASPAQTREETQEWTDSLATDNSSALMQSSRYPERASRLRRNTGHRKATLTERLTGK